MANLLFKRGLHANLPTTAVDGAFYLTEDTHRLYAGIGTELVDLNKYIPSDMPAFDLELDESDFVETAKNNKVNVSLDSSTAAYSNLRRVIKDGGNVHKDMVNIEQMINYFNYSYINNSSKITSNFCIFCFNITFIYFSCRSI